jgi:nicotinamidase-related amidase
MTESEWRQRLEYWPHKMPRFTVDPHHCALVVVDMQNSTANLNHGWNSLLEEKYPEIAAYVIPRLRDVVIPNNRRLIHLFRQYGLPIIYLTVSRQRADGADWPPPLRRRYQHFEDVVEREVRAADASFDSEVIEELKPTPDDFVIRKTSTGPFNSTGLDQLVRNLGVKAMVITGVATNSCVETTLRDAADRGYDCLLVEDACSTLHPAYHEATLLNCEMIFGNVRTTDEIIEEFCDILDASSETPGG